MDPVVMYHLLGAHLLTRNIGDYSPVSVESLVRLSKETWLFDWLSPENQSEG
jgi:hypothetical protein